MIKIEICFCDQNSVNSKIKLTMRFCVREKEKKRKEKKNREESSEGKTIGGKERKGRGRYLKYKA